MSKLDTLNQWMKSQPPRQMIMLILALVIGILFLMYLFFVAPMEENRAKLEGEYNKLKRELQTLQSKQIKNQIEDLKKSASSIKSQTKELKDQAIGMEARLKDLPELKHDNASWAGILEQLLDYSVRLGVEITTMEISSPQEDYIGKLSIFRLLHVEGSGDFLAIEKWIRHAEGMPKALKLKTLQIQEGKTPSFVAEFEVLGWIK